MPCWGAHRGFDFKEDARIRGSHVTSERTAAEKEAARRASVAKMPLCLAAVANILQISASTQQAQPWPQGWPLYQRWPAIPLHAGGGGMRTVAMYAKGMGQTT